MNWKPFSWVTVDGSKYRFPVFIGPRLKKLTNKGASLCDQRFYDVHSSFQREYTSNTFVAFWTHSGTSCTVALTTTTATYAVKFSQPSLALDYLSSLWLYSGRQGSSLTPTATRDTAGVLWQSTLYWGLSYQQQPGSTGRSRLIYGFWVRRVVALWGWRNDWHDLGWN